MKYIVVIAFFFSVGVRAQEVRWVDESFDIGDINYNGIPLIAFHKIMSSGSPLDTVLYQTATVLKEAGSWELTISNEKGSGQLKNDLLSYEVIASLDDPYEYELSGLTIKSSASILNFKGLVVSVGDNLSVVSSVYPSINKVKGYSQVAGGYIVAIRDLNKAISVTFFYDVNTEEILEIRYFRLLH
tara:strand:+ start:154 stop:711 length:558 start_codon:yes stop_codon:yes gene_type:complete